MFSAVLQGCSTWGWGGLGIRKHHHGCACVFLGCPVLAEFSCAAHFLNIGSGCTDAHSGSVTECTASSPHACSSTITATNIITRAPSRLTGTRSGTSRDWCRCAWLGDLCQPASNQQLLSQLTCLQQPQPTVATRTSSHQGHDIVRESKTFNKYATYSNHSLCVNGSNP